jgi:hypothetical protein
MLVNALFYVLLIAMASSTFLTAGLFMTRVTIVQQARAALAPGYQRAAAALQQTIAADIQHGGVPNPLSSFTPLPAVCADSACTYRASETIAIQQNSSGGTCGYASPNCAVNEESNGYVNEQRVAARITVTVTAPGGETLATRSEDVILRTFAAPPYAAILGARDGSFDGLAPAQTAGDDGGTLPATPNPCASATPDGGTVVRVAYRNTATNACTEGSTFRSNAYSANSAGTGWRP